MANPLRYVAAMKARKSVVVKMETCKSETEARALAAEWFDSKEYKRVALHSFRLGSRRNPETHFVVRAYA